jgi:DNA end-binding protein Ku
MARPIWTGSVGFGLVNVPVKLYSAVSQKEVRFHMLHDADGARIHMKRVCSSDGEEVPYQHIAKGYEIGRGRYVMVSQEELEALDPKGNRTIEIEDFVDIQEIDPVHYEHTYHLVPGDGAEKPYALLLAAMKNRGKVAVARMVMRTKQYLCTVRPLGKGLALSTMNYADEIVDVGDIEGFSLAGAKPKERELEIAEQLVESLATRFEPARYKDDHRERVEAMLKRKAKGQEIVAAPEPEAPAETVDLFEALQKSLAGQGKRRAARPARPARAAARRGAVTTRRKASGTRAPAKAPARRRAR